MIIVSRMLSIATFVLWLIIVFFSVTAVYSVLNLGVTIGNVQMLPSSDGISFSLPFSINNSGYYEIADLNLTTRVTDPNGKLLDRTETIVPSIHQGTSVNSSHTIDINIEDILSLEPVTLLLNDSEFNVEIFAGLNFARAVPVQLSFNTTIPWGAPFSNFSIEEISVSLYNSTHTEVTVPISFQNHAIVHLSGTLELEVYNNSQERIATGAIIISVQSLQNYADNIVIYIKQEDATKLTSNGDLHLIFEMTMFTVDWWEPYG
jgi:hypothetical protein